MRKPAFCICENQDADQLCGKQEADQRLCFRYTDSTIPLLPNSEISSLCGCTDQFVSDLVGNPEDQFSHDTAHIFNEQHHENVDQQCSNKAADQRLCFRYMDSTIPLLP